MRTRIRQGDAGLVKSWSCTSRVFIPISLRRFPPVAKGGGRGGCPGTTSHKVFPCSLPLSPFASLSRGEKNRFRFPRRPHHPPCPPSQGGERDRTLATSFHPAQQKHVSRNRPSSSVNTNFSPAQCRARRREWFASIHLGTDGTRAVCRKPFSSTVLLRRSAEL